MTALLLVLVAACSSEGDARPASEGDEPVAAGDETIAIVDTDDDDDADEGPEADDEPPEIEWVMLHDVQGLHGGRAVYFLDDHRFVYQRVEPASGEGLVDTRYEGSLDPGARDALRMLLFGADLGAMDVPDRPGVPDEARAVLAVRFDDGSSHRLAKWEGVAHSGFSAVYRRVFELMEAALPAEPTSVGPYDHAWRPDGVRWPPLH